MRRMDINRGEPAGDAARRIGKAIHAKWGVGQKACDNGVLFLLAVEDRQVFISTGRGAQKALSDNSLVDIISSMRPKLRAQNYDEAVEEAVVDIGLGLAGKPRSGHDWEWFPVIFFGVIALMLLRSCWNSYKARRQYKDCRTALKKVKDEQEKLRTREWSKPRTCPICLEEFSKNPEEVPTPTAAPLPTQEAEDEDDDASPSAPLLSSESGNNIINTTTTGVSMGGSGSDEEPSTSAAAAAAVAGPSTSSAGLRRRTSGRGEGLNGNVGSAAAPGGSQSHDAIVRNPITLRCGHTFCEPCLETWLDKAPTCPICRERMDGGDPPPAKAAAGEGSQTQSVGGAGGRQQLGAAAADSFLTTELVFRLMQLQSRYPSYITPSVFDTWRDEAQSTGTFNWEAAREFQLNNPAIRAHHESLGASGNSYSFGGGGGGGGGGAGGSW